MKFFLIVLLFLCGCNYSILVSKDNIIIRETGYLVISQEYVEFIPYRFKNNLLSGDSIKQNKLLKKGFYLYDVPYKKLNKLKENGIKLDNTDSCFIVPVELEFRRIKETNRQLRRTQKKLQKHILVYGGEMVEYYVSQPQVYFYSARILGSASKEGVEDK